MPRVVNAFFLLVLCFASAAAAQARSVPKRAITRIASDLYRFQNNFHYSVFLVTPEGVIATDPINAEAERTLFAVDFIPVKSVAFKDFPDAYLPEWISSLRRVEGMDFDILAPGHGRLGDKSDVTAFREYMSDLYGQVLEQARMGKSLEATKAAVDLSKYKSWGRFEAWSPLNIEGAYHRIQLNRRGN